MNYDTVIAHLEAYFTEHAAELSLADTFFFFDALGKIKEAAAK